PGGTVTAADEPTAVIRSPATTTIWSVSMRPLVESKRCPARTASVRAVGAHLYTPPSAPTQGVDPAPRHWACGTCADITTARLTLIAAILNTFRTIPLLESVPNHTLGNVA